jgi:hypothetical protein
MGSYCIRRIAAAIILLALPQAVLACMFCDNPDDPPGGSVAVCVDGPITRLILTVGSETVGPVPVATNSNIGICVNQVCVQPCPGLTWADVTSCSQVCFSAIQ